jgi:uncharacterized protein YndB with AHSA1/START domain
MSRLAVEIRRTLPAPIDEVFRWWTEPALMREWMTPVGSCDIENDLRVGGRLHVVMRGDGRVIEHEGQYLEINPPRRLSFTWTSAYTEGQPSIVTVELEPHGVDWTSLRLTHSALPEPGGATHQQGWQRMTDRLADKLENRLADKLGNVRGG